MVYLLMEHKFLRLTITFKLFHENFLCESTNAKLDYWIGLDSWNGLLNFHFWHLISVFGTDIENQCLILSFPNQKGVNLM